MSRLPANFKTFDFYDDRTGIATSAKTLDTMTVSKINDPAQVYSSIKGNIDDVVNFGGAPALSGRVVNSADITSRVVVIAIPSGTTSTQWVQIQRAIQYGQTNGVVVKVTVVK